MLPLLQAAKLNFHFSLLPTATCYPDESLMLEIGLAASTKQRVPQSSVLILIKIMVPMMLPYLS